MPMEVAENVTVTDSHIHANSAPQSRGSRTYYGNPNYQTKNGAAVIYSIRESTIEIPCERTNP